MLALLPEDPQLARPAALAGLGDSLNSHLTSGLIEENKARRPGPRSGYRLARLPEKPPAQRPSKTTRERKARPIAKGGFTLVSACKRSFRPNWGPDPKPGPRRELIVDSRGNGRVQLVGFLGSPIHKNRGGFAIAIDDDGVLHTGVGVDLIPLNRFIRWPLQ